MNLMRTLCTQAIQRTENATSNCLALEEKLQEREMESL